MPENKGSVLYVGGFELPDKNAAAHRVVNNAKVFRELGYNVIFCGVDKEITRPSENATIIYGFDTFSIPYPSNNKQWIKQMLSIGVYADLLSRYPDIKLVVCYNLHAVPLAKVLRFCHKRGIKVVADCTEWYENKPSFNPIKLIKCLDTSLSMRVYQKKCDGIIAISTYLANYYKASVKDIIVVPPLVDLNEDKFKCSSGKVNNKVTTFVYCGNPSARKELLGDVVNAFQKITDLDYNLVIVGITKEQFLHMYKIDFDDSKTQFKGKLPHKDALNIVRQSDYAIVVRPRTRVTMAGFPTKFAEAISVSTPVIANDTSDLLSYIESGRNGYIVDMENLENDFRRILTVPEKPDVINDIFDYRNWIKQFDDFLKSLV